MLDLVVRRGREADAPALAPLAGSADRALWRVRAAEAGEEVLLVAERDGDLVGAVSVRWEADCDPPHPWLYGLHVHPEARRNGLGTVLVRDAETVVSLSGAVAVSLDVDQGEHGLVAFYRRLGYEQVGPHRHHWRSVDPRTGAVTAEGFADTWLMRHELGRVPAVG